MFDAHRTITLKTLLVPSPNTNALTSGEVRSPTVNFEFADAKVANREFKALVREQKYDLGELATVTCLQAKLFGKGYTLMPAVIVARGQHHTIFYNQDRGHLRPSDLNGRRVGVRAYTQTTGVWLRGILEEDYGVDVESIQWVTFEEPHLAEYQDPPWVCRAPAGKQLEQMLRDGEIDAAIFGRENPEGLAPLIPDAQNAARKWAERRGGIPINHLMVVKESITESHPEAVREVYRLLKESAARSPRKDDGAIRFGVEAIRKSLETIVDYSVRQRLLPRRFEVDELFDDVTRSLV